MWYDEALDMLLVEIKDPIPYSFRAYYAGWDASGSPGGPSMCIHHPRADVKKMR